MSDHDRLTRLLTGHREGLTRQQLMTRLDLDDRAVRKIIEDLVSSGREPIYAEGAPGARRYRIAGPTDWEGVNRACAEDTSRAISSHKKAKGRLLAMEAKYGASMFLDRVPHDLDAA